MKKTTLTFGFIAGGVLSAMMLVTLPFHDVIGFDNSVVVGYTSMVAAFLLVYFGVRSYRDSVGGGVVGFGRAMAVGTLIVTLASACYVVTWQAIYYGGYGDEFMTKYQAHVIAKERAKGTSEAELATREAEMKRFAELYKNPVVNAGVTFIEPLPVGLLIALVTAGVLSRRRGSGGNN